MLESNDDIEKFKTLEGYKLLLISSPTCPHCRTADELLKKSPNTLDACFQHVGVCFFNRVLAFCQKNSIKLTPTFIIYYEEGEEVSRISYAPKTQDEFFDWITDSIT